MSFSKLQSILRNQHYKDQSRTQSNEMGYTPKLLIDNVSAKLPCRAFAINDSEFECGWLSDDS